MQPPVPTEIDAALAHHQAGRLDRAESLYREILARDPRNFDALHYMGVLASQSGHPAHAVTLIGKALEIDPKITEAHSNLGNALLAQGLFDRAEASYRKAVALNPRFADGHLNLGIALLAAGRPAEAAEAARQAVTLAAGSAAAHSILGSALKALQEFGAAESAYREAIRLDPGFAEAHMNLGVLLNDRFRPAEAVEALTRADGLAPDNPDILTNLAMALLEHECPDAALVACRRSLELRPGHGESWSNLGVILAKLDRRDDALAVHRRAITLRPDYAQAYLNLGLLLFDLRDRPPALSCYDHALALRPDYPKARMSRAITRLTEGDLAGGWDDYAARWIDDKPEQETRGWRDFRQACWDGREDLSDKTVLVWREQGVGDQLSFCSALPDLVARAGKVIVECSPKLVALFERSFPGIESRPEDRSGDDRRTDFDRHMPVGDLFRHFRRRIEDFAGRGPWLRSDPAAVAAWRRRLAALGPHPKIGLSWRSSVAGEQRSRHFFPDLLQWKPILLVPGVTFVNLQYDECAAEIAAAEAACGVSVQRFPDLNMLDDLAGTADLVAALDHVVTVGTTVAILAGGLGASTSLFMLRHAHWAELGTDRIPWLQNTTMLHRTAEENWDAAVLRAAGRVAQLARAPMSPPA